MATRQEKLSQLSNEALQQAIGDAISKATDPTRTYAQRRYWGGMYESLIGQVNYRARVIKHPEHYGIPMAHWGPLPERW